MTPDVPPAHEHRPQVDLPEWMRNPTPARRTLGRRVSELVEQVPALRAARRALWRRWDRPRWSERHPVVSAILSFFGVAVTATALVTGTLYLFHKMLRGEL
ncbi:hypothetical protein [Micromonospora echinaurantiaca]|uniref:hypothetical protein n=1 Tax=Micromonospora echinaurantiaca TaxID=47857 RepID=UPI00142374B6